MTRKTLEVETNHENHAMESKRVEILYTNYRGEQAWRSILPVKLWFGVTEWHTGEQWFIDAEDVDRKVMRSFALHSIRIWRSMNSTEPDGST